MYGDPEVHGIRHTIAAHEGVRPENIVVGEGIDSLLGLLVRLVCAPGDAVVTSDGAYPTFNFHVAGFGGALRKVPYVADREDPSALRETARSTRAKLIYFANPDNPMGSWHPRSAVEAFVADVPDGCLLVLDEAYGQFLPPDDLPQIDADDPRVIRFRTFSKAYGMAGARVGYGIGAPALIKSFDKVRNHFGLARISQAGALAALEDQAYLAHAIAQVQAATARISEIAIQNGLEPLPTAANFVALDCGRDGRFAKSVLDALVENGVFVRMPSVAPQDRCIRVSAGRSDDLDLFADALPRALAQAREKVIGADV